MAGVDVGPLQPARRPPLVELPRGGDNQIKTRFYIETAAGEAGCCICKRPIPKGVSRVRVSVGLWPPRSGRTEESYYLHPLCLAKRSGSEVMRSGEGCWDCGIEPPAGSEHRALCFTVARFVWSRLCPRCTEKPRWELCLLCDIHYPAHMVQRLAQCDTPEESNPFANINLSAVTMPESACTNCITRHDLATFEHAREQADESRIARATERMRFERIKKRILEEGLDAAADQT